MTYIKSYKDLIVWQKSMQLVKEVFILTSKFPKSETYGLTSQMRRAAVSIPSNIAEGYGRKSPKEYSQFYSIAYGSALELETQVIIAKELEFLKSEFFTKIDQLLQEVSKMLNVMTRTMKQLNARR
ncbi:MAG: four helix bundle protein [Patescibacteria group bacterium]|nr:four helix bundle protein [Patescibacteria group bacterium]